MKIVIRTYVEKKFRITLYLPTFLVKSKFIWDRIEKETDVDYYEIVNYAYKEIKKFIKKNGHFTLFEVSTPEAYVKIRL